MLTRRGVGTAVFGGMIAATALGVFAIPLLYVVFRRLRSTWAGGVRVASCGETLGALPAAANPVDGP
jgi:hypothetical protein